jgi:hypothetical protein
MCYFDIDEVTITNSFKPYFDLCLRIYEVIQSGTIIEEVNKLKYDEAELESLNDEKIAMKTYVILTYINNAYLPAIEDKVLPDSLAIPLLKVCNILEIRPCWTYSNNTHCVEVIDKAQPITFENTRMKITHTNTETEEWFYRVSYIVDIRVCEIIDVIYESNHILYKYENKGEIDFDSIIKEDQEKLSAIMDKMVDILTFVRSTARKIFTNVI